MYSCLSPRYFPEVKRLTVLLWIETLVAECILYDDGYCKRKVVLIFLSILKEFENQRDILIQQCYDYKEQPVPYIVLGNYFFLLTVVHMRRN